MGRNFLNPLYTGSKISCNMYYDHRSGMYRVRDFGNGDYSGDCFSLVAMPRGLDYRNAADFVKVLHTIDRELYLGLDGDSPAGGAVGTGGCRRLWLVPGARGGSAGEAGTDTEGAAVPADRPELKPYRAAEKPSTERELAYWDASSITVEVLRRYGTISLAKYRGEMREDKTFGSSSTPAEPMFGYRGKRGVKVYRPMSKVHFVYGGYTGDNYCLGLGQLPSRGDLPLLTGGEKDVPTLAVYGFHATCFNSETSVIPVEIARRLVCRFRHIVLLHDTDKAGLRCSEEHRARLAEYGVKRLVLPLPGTKAEKDVTNYFRTRHTREELMGLLLELFDTLYGGTLAMLKSYEIDYDHLPEQAVTTITVEDMPLGSKENILCAVGGEETGKSNYATALVAGAIVKRETDADLLGVRVEPNRKGRAVLLYDTEQSEQQLHENTGWLLRRVGRERMSGYLHMYCLTGVSGSEQLIAIVQNMDRYHHLHGDIHLVVIDGVANLIHCANDEMESMVLIDEIYRLAGIYRACIAVVVHFMPNGLKLRGHLDSELQCKPAAILSIEKDEDPEMSAVKVLRVRDGSSLSIPLMQFRWDKQTGMSVYMGGKPKAKKEKHKEKELTEMAREAFTRQEKYGYVELCELIQEMLEVKERTAKGYIRYVREKETIEKEGDCYVRGQGRV